MTPDRMAHETAGGPQRGPRMLQSHVDRVVTRVGAAWPGSRAVFRGHDLHADLPGIAWFDLCGLGIKGERLTPQQRLLLETIWVWTSYPDSRIWNNRVAALAGTTRSTPTLALSAANAVSEATIYGRRNEFKAVSLFKRVHGRMQEGATLAQALDEHLKTQGKLPGYGRPIAAHDERIPPTMKLARELGIAGGPHVALAFEIERHLKEQGKPLQMNLGALVSAFGADFGFTARGFSLYCYTAFIGGMQPVYLEAADKPPGAVFPTPVSGVAYSGVGRREWVEPLA